ncbi:MAG: dTDP-4-dehydrorhamnose 3,5-epimerase family protein [Candidatus Levybacteria bacterium]|nr:dTDP-4-dehydrorhamnose 3,5-epimerase family protein [Candidatus Levybacteria bacterium]
MEQNSPITKTSIPGLILIQRQTFSDERGFFREPARIKEIEEAAGIKFDIAQMNHARSSQNTLRGIHVAPWNKLVYVPRGRVQSVIVDLRKDSEVFGKYESFIIGDDNRSSIFIPAGLGNSYAVLSDEVDYTYLTDQEWEPDKEFGVLWNDPTLGIRWEFEGEPVLSEKDLNNPTVKDAFPEKF